MRHIKPVTFENLRQLYFHNCVYSQLYPTARLRDGTKTLEILGRHQPETRLIIVGDAHMAPYELTSRYGAIDYWHQNEVDGHSWLNKLKTIFKRRFGSILSLSVFGTTRPYT